MRLAERKPATQRPRRIANPPSAFTLMELLLVVAIMVVIAALAAPAVQRTFSRQALQKSADRVRVAMGQARVRSIRTGEEHALLYSPGGAWFNVAPLVKVKEQVTISQQRTQIAAERRQSDFEEDLLPRGVTFVAGETGEDARSAQTLADSQDSDGQGLKMVLFYPDGTSQDAKLILQNEHGSFIEVQLRGLTGLAKSVRLERPPGE